MANYNIVRFGDKYAVKKTTLWFFTSYVDLTQDCSYWITWDKGGIGFHYCLGTLERAEFVFTLINTEGVNIS